jgi:hypothetical protein
MLIFPIRRNALALLHPCFLGRQQRRADLPDGLFRHFAVQPSLQK